VTQSLGWRDSFFTVLVVSVLLFVLVAIVLDEGPVSKGKVDSVGALTLGASMLLILTYLTEGSSIGWVSTENVALLVPGLVLAGAFLAVERRTATPLIQMSVMRIRNVLVANIVRIVAGITGFLFYFAFVYYGEYPKPYGLGLGVLSTGLVLVPATLSTLVWGPLGGKLVPKTGPKPLFLVGALIVIAGFLLCILYRSSVLELTADGVVYFAGYILVVIASVNTISVSLPKDQATIGLSINTMLSTLGQSFGPIIATTLLVSYTEPLTRIVNGQTTVVGQIASPLAFNLIFGVGILFSGLTFAVALFTRNYKFPKP
jgi:MFS family permease